MNNFNSLNEIIDYIENHLDSTIDIGLLARKSGLSLYEFRRIFSFAAGIPISEYIRKRRLSCAACDLLQPDATVTDIAIKYGYDAPSSFSRAFKEFHGITPTELGKSDCTLGLFAPLEFETKVSGGTEIRYTLKKEPDFDVCGLLQVSDISDTECCEDAWSSFYANSLSETVLNACDNKLYAVYVNGANSVKCLIGARGYENGELCKIHIPQALWMCFTLHGSDDATVNEFYQNILWRCLKAGLYEKDESVPNIEIFPQNMDEPDFEWEIRIAVKKKSEREK